MRPDVIFLALCIVLEPFAGAAHAEFQLTGPAVSPAPAPEPSSDAPAQRAQFGKRPAGPAVAYGFGHQVSLAFAARQIVPRGVKVSFGQALDPERVLVDWKGGRPWPDVLRSTLRPAGLQVTFCSGAVRIELGSAS